MKRWVVCRTRSGGIEYRSKDPNVLEMDGWVDGRELKRVRVWEEKEKVLEYLSNLGLLYPQLTDMEMVKVMVFSEVGIIGLVEK